MQLKLTITLLLRFMQVFKIIYILENHSIHKEHITST